MESDSVERYDRQIRLWGEHGQSKCSNSKICLINANSLGTEILKGLCLAGIGSFTILDSHKLTPEDVGCNFLPQSSTGKSRGESAKNMLLDLNEEVCGETYPLETHLPHIASDNSISDTLDHDRQEREFWKQFNCVIASGFLYSDQIIRLSRICWSTNIPLILCKSIGFYGFMRSQIKEHLIIETHPEYFVPDFNLEKPLPSSVISIFNHQKVLDKSSQNISRFWLIVKAIKEFVLNKNEGRLPASGIIPDTISNSEEYVEQQMLYAKKAREDLDEVFSIVQNFNNSTSCSPGSSLYDETKLICKNIRDLRIMCTQPIYQDYDFKANSVKEDDEEDELITISVCVKGLDLFYSIYGRLPGCQDDQVETDINKLKDCVKQMIGKSLNQLKTLDQCLYELCRCGGAEIHATSAFLGGCIAQEVIKLITNQYIPVDDTLVYNAMTASTRSFRFNETFKTE